MKDVRCCPYCGAPQFWSTFSGAFCHVHDLRLWCDAEAAANRATRTS